MKLNKQNFIMIIIAVAVLVGFAFFVRIGERPDSIVALKTLGMTCESCSERILKELQRQKGVTSVEVDVEAGRVIAAYNSKVTKPEILAGVVTGLGYGSTVLQVLSSEQYRAITGRSLPMRTAMGGGFGGCCNKKGQTVVIIPHNSGTSFWSDRTIYLKDGRVADGRSDQRNDKTIQHADKNLFKH
jgi:periplasmic mercuric ion binding protein